MTSQFPRLFFWHVVRHVARHRMLALLNVASVALGIAVYLAIQIANHSANRSFAAGIDLVAGKSHLEIRGDVDETLWPIVARQPGVQAVTATVEGVLTLPDSPGEYLRVIGIDLFTGSPFRTFDLDGGGGARLEIEPWLGAGDGIAVTAEFAGRTGLKIGDRFRAQANARTITLTVLALLDAGDSAGASQSRFAAMDLGWAQELFGAAGRLRSLQIMLDDPTRGAAVAESLRAVLPPDLTAAPPRQRSFQVQTMLSAFQLNLTALSMVSLLVGVFLIYNTIAASVARRRVEIGILRAIGMSRAEVRWLFLGEVCLFGIAGIAFGMVGGVALAQVLTGAVAQTISSLYLLVSIERSYVDPVQLIVAATFGFATVLAGAWLPAAEAARVDPVRALSLGAHAERSAGHAPRWAWLGGWSLALAGLAVWAALHGGPPALSFAGAFCVLAGFAAFAPRTTQLAGSVAARMSRASVLWRLSADNLRRSIHRNAITVAALASAVAMMIGLMVMIYSFRRSVDRWVQRAIVADVFIAPTANETVGLGAAVPTAAVTWLRARPEVASVDTFSEVTAPLRHASGETEPIPVAVIDGEYRDNLSFLGGDEVAKMARVFRGEAVAVSEPLARKFDLREGGRVTLLTPGGPVAFEIAGVYADFSRDQGVLMIEHRHFRKFWDDPGVFSLAVYLRPGAVFARFSEEFEAEFSRAGEFVVYSNRSLRERIFAVFDQTFAVTHILRTVAIIVAIAGIFLSVTTLVAERAREIAVLRAIGASPGQIQQLLMGESALIGLVATALGLAAGLVLAMTLTWAVNPAFFGWTIQLHFPWLALIATPLWIVPAAVLAAWYPARRASRAEIAEALREE